MAADGMNNIVVNEELLTPQIIDRLKRRDKRFEALDNRLMIEQELRNSICLKVVLEAASEQAAEALEKLAEVNPSATGDIVYLQAQVYRARFIARTLNRAIQHGEAAEKSLADEPAIDVTEGEER